jgi:hypothetical protein
MATVKTFTHIQTTQREEWSRVEFTTRTMHEIDGENGTFLYVSRGDNDDDLFLEGVFPAKVENIHFHEEGKSEWAGSGEWRYDQDDRNGIGFPENGTVDDVRLVAALTGWTVLR